MVSALYSWDQGAQASEKQHAQDKLPFGRLTNREQARVRKAYIVIERNLQLRMLEVFTQMKWPADKVEAARDLMQQEVRNEILLTSTTPEIGSLLHILEAGRHLESKFLVLVAAEHGAIPGDPMRRKTGQMSGRDNMLPDSIRGVPSLVLQREMAKSYFAVHHRSS